MSMLHLCKISEDEVVALRRARMREGFLRAAKDKDVVDMAEWGMDECVGLECLGGCR